MSRNLNAYLEKFPDLSFDYVQKPPYRRRVERRKFNRDRHLKKVPRSRWIKNIIANALRLEAIAP